jgi:uncharacterized protein (DUF433 family)
LANASHNYINLSAVSLVLNLIANGMDRTEIIEEYPILEAEDIDQCLQYAAYLAEEELYTNQKVS